MTVFLSYLSFLTLHLTIPYDHLFLHHHNIEDDNKTIGTPAIRAPHVLAPTDLSVVKVIRCSIDTTIIPRLGKLRAFRFNSNIVLRFVVDEINYYESLR